MCLGLVALCCVATTGCVPVMMAAASESADNKQNLRTMSAAEEMLLGGNYTPFTAEEARAYGERFIAAARLDPILPCPRPDERSLCTRAPKGASTTMAGPTRAVRQLDGDPSIKELGIREGHWSYVIDGRQLFVIDWLKLKGPDLLRFSFPEPRAH